MAFLSTPATAPSITDRLRHAGTAFVLRLRRQRMYRKTLNELDGLTDRELMDLGLNRSGLSRVAWESSVQ